MISKLTDCAVLNNGVRMPWLGLGVFGVDDGQEVEQVVHWALEAGYRSIDTATIYHNEQGVGKAIKTSGVPREEIFLTTKIWTDDMRRHRHLEAFEESLERLQMEYVDLYLIHWPVAGVYKDAWAALEEIYGSGRAKAIGVSNFMIIHLEDLLQDANVVPAVNQVEFHPQLVQPDLLRFCRDYDIQLEAWSPIIKGKVMSVPEIQEIAQKYQKTPVQVVLRWDLQHEVVTIPKSVHQDRILANAQIFDFELSEDDISALDALDRGRRRGADPYNFDF